MVEAETAADLKGDSLVHTDFRSDNIFFHRDHTLLIDWNWACKGNPKFDLISWLPTLHTEGGPPPWEFTLDEPNLIAMQAGYLAHRVSNPPADLNEVDLAPAAEAAAVGAAVGGKGARFAAA